jgi:lipoate-protein ligase A
VVSEVSGTAGEVHGRPLPAHPRRAVTVCRVDAPALVLGSTQPDIPRRGVDVVRRRSGGGAVLVTPGDPVWVDVVVPAGDPLWTDDVNRAFHWLGAAWTRALRMLDVDAHWHDGPLVRTALSDSVCFAGLGPGEVTVDGRKVVGLAQRRTRDLALFQCAALLTWDPDPLADLLALDTDDRRTLATAAVGLDRPADAIESSFLAYLLGS